jgi:Skp family chaperone for outer membrane proteins
VSTFGPNSLPQASGKGILLTTTDAHTLTDGPTLYLAEDVDKIGKFYIQQSKIPDQVFRAIQEKIERNNVINKQIAALEKEAEDKAGKPAADDSKKAEKEPTSKEMQRLLERVATLRGNLHTVHLSPAYIPNTKAHQDIWIPAEYQHVKNAFVSHVDEEDVKEIMGLSVDNQKKLLLIMGIGVFSLDVDKAYMEIMKRLAYNQRLFLIIASSDYIYGTNYQFCHGFIGKDLANMTQQKTIQAIGRVGRNNIQQEYTVRFRDDAVIERLFKKVERNLEAENMCRLFCDEE